MIIDVSSAAQTEKRLLRVQKVSEQNQKHFCVPDTNFVSATNVARAGNRVNICVGNNVSAIMCPRLPVPLFLRLSLPSTLIHHEKGAYQKRSSNRRSSKTSSSRFRVNGKTL